MTNLFEQIREEGERVRKAEREMVERAFGYEEEEEIEEEE